MNILIADLDQARASALADRLRATNGIGTVLVAAPGRNLGEVVRAERPDVVIVDMARPDRDSLDHVRAVTGQAVAVTLFVDEDDPEFMDAAISAGVVSYHVNSVALADIKPVLRSAIAMFRRQQAREARLVELEIEREERRNIDAAKRLLIRREGMSEPAAHRFLQRRAMARQIRIADVARTLLENENGGNR